MKNVVLFFFLCIATLTYNISNATIHCVALAGGAGERLWPLSRKDCPKQFLSINEKQTLLEDSLDRLTAIDDKIEIWISSTHQYAAKIYEIIENRKITLIEEPSCNNTAPAILLSCMHIAQQDPEAIIAFSPTDHYIADKNSFALAMKAAINFAKKSEAIVLLGVKPTYPATSYGYINFKREENAIITPVLGFYEKPHKEKAQHFLEDGAFLWNVGIFCARAKTFIHAFQQYAPDIYEAMEKYLNGEREYETIPKVSFDYAVLEKYTETFVHPVSFNWSDIGDMKTFLTLKNKYSTNKNMFQVNAHENLICCKNKFVALVDVDNLCVVENDGILLVIPQDRVNKIRDVVAQLKIDPELSYYRWK